VVFSCGLMVCAVQDVAESGLILHAEKERGERKKKKKKKKKKKRGEHIERAH
jgi:hypothetical protein